MYVDPDGVQFVHDDDLAQAFAGEARSTRRASHVEPEGDGTWTVDLTPVGGPVEGGFETRRAALAWEVEWLGQELQRRRVGGWR